jgi:4-diphosphocytidyl-2-C-methyl-D-erythritol kinase
MGSAPMTRPEIFLSAHAKVNLCLHVGQRRADGFHELQSLVAFAFVDDGLWFEADDTLSLSLIGPFVEGLPHDGEANFAMKAARLLCSRTGTRRGARITLQKCLPVASGLGGGSADAAAVLLGLNELWALGKSNEALHQIALDVGSDVAACLVNRTLWMEGRGERLTILPPLPDLWLILVNPRVAVSSAEAFRRLKLRSGVELSVPDKPFADVQALARYLATTRNDLEGPACDIAPVIGDVLNEIAAMPGALLSRMSGSGATCFGLFAHPDPNRDAMSALAEKHPNWWIAGTRLAPARDGAPRPI